MITNNKTGGRTIELFIPFELDGKTVDRITLSPFRFGDMLRWTEGEFKNSFALLVEMSGVSEGVIRNLRYPDADRMMEAFLAMLPNDLRDDIANGRIPVASGEVQAQDVPAQETEEQHEAERVNMRGPGEPLPEDESGFDLSEEEP